MDSDIRQFRDLITATLERHGVLGQITWACIGVSQITDLSDAAIWFSAVVERIYLPNGKTCAKIKSHASTVGEAIRQIDTLLVAECSEAEYDPISMGA